MERISNILFGLLVIYLCYIAYVKTLENVNDPCIEYQYYHDMINPPYRECVKYEKNHQ